MTYEMSGVRLFWKDGKYVVSMDGKIIPPVNAEWEENPILAWRRFIGMVDDRVMRRIGDYLESQGRNRYTGELKTSERRKTT